MPALVDITGQRFGRLVVLRRLGSAKYGESTWLCRCDCSKNKVILGHSLRQGLTKSCGCLQRERASQTKKKHGASTTETYYIWAGMRTRCKNPKATPYKNYGGRGISVCERWNSFDNFLADMGERPPGLSIDRIDNDGNYEPDNCRWATQSEQTGNQRKRRSKAEIREDMR